RLRLRWFTARRTLWVLLVQKAPARALARTPSGVASCPASHPRGAGNQKPDSSQRQPGGVFLVALLLRLQSLPMALRVAAHCPQASQSHPILLARPSRLVHLG